MLLLMLLLMMKHNKVLEEGRDGRDVERGRHQQAGRPRRVHREALRPVPHDGPPYLAGDPHGAPDCDQRRE